MAIQSKQFITPPSGPDRIDFKGQCLCDPCWNGTHFHRLLGASGKPKGGTVIDCLGGNCQCSCRQLLKEWRIRISASPKKSPRIDTDQPSLFEQAFESEEMVA